MLQNLGENGRESTGATAMHYLQSYKYMKRYLKSLGITGIERLAELEFETAACNANGSSVPNGHVRRGPSKLCQGWLSSTVPWQSHARELPGACS